MPWGAELREAFGWRFEVVRKHNDQNNPDLPFRYLASDGIWEAFEGDGVTPIRRNLLVADYGVVFGRFCGGFEQLAADAARRWRLREALVARYFPQHAAELLGVRRGVVEVPVVEGEDADDGDETDELVRGLGRSPAFRRKILDVYDHQCAACGLRIKLPAAPEVSFIDAAHLVPFALSGNDHPTNGLALCKNHHWALDRHLLAPGTDLRWRVSPALDARRSTGEAELLRLAGHVGPMGPMGPMGPIGPIGPMGPMGPMDFSCGNPGAPWSCFRGGRLF